MTAAQAREIAELRETIAAYGGVIQKQRDEAASDRAALERFRMLRTCPNDASRLDRLDQALNIDEALAARPPSTPSAEPFTADDAYEGGRADGWAAAVDVARAVVDVEGVVNYEETNRAAGAVTVLAALEQGGELVERQNAEPPRIEDMAPGTTFTAGITGDPEVRLWFVRDAVGGLASSDGVIAHRLSIDPSSVRDVTPPTALPEAGR